MHHLIADLKNVGSRDGDRNKRGWNCGAENRKYDCHGSEIIGIQLNSKSLAQTQFLAETTKTKIRAYFSHFLPYHHNQCITELTFWLICFIFLYTIVSNFQILEITIITYSIYML